MKVVCILIFLGALKFSLIGQNDPIANYCEFKTAFDSLPTINKLERKFRKNGGKFSVQAEIAFVIAKRYAPSNDSLSKIWFAKCIEFSKKSYEKTKKAAQKAIKLYVIGLAYYFVADYKNAELYLRKAFTCRSPYKCGNYYWGLSLSKLGRCEEAIKLFETFNKETNQNTSDQINKCGKN